MTNNYNAINQYLDDLGIDARRIPADSVTAEGYTLWPDPNTDKVRYGTDAVNPIGTQFGVPWPNPEVYKNVVLLMNGATLEEILEPVNPAKKPTAKQVELADTLRTKAQSNLDKPNPVVKKGAQ